MGGHKSEITDTLLLCPWPSAVSGGCVSANLNTNYFFNQTMGVNSLKTAKNKISLSASYEPEDGLQEGPVPGGPSLWWGQAPCTRAQGLDGKRGLAVCMTLRRVLTSVLSTIQQNGGQGKPLRRTPLEVKAEAAWSLPEPRAPTRRSGQALCPLPAASPPRVTPGHLPAASVLTMPHAGNQTSRAPARPGPLP